MKFIRLLLIFLGLTLALLAVLVAAAFTPALQTWIAQMVLAEQPGFHGSLGSLSAGFTKVEIADVRMDVGGAAITLPEVHASLSVVTALRDRKLLVQSLVAKGWTIDLSRSQGSEDTQARVAPAPGSGEKAGVEAQASVRAAQSAAKVWHGILGGWKLPCDVTLYGVELEGDVLVAVTEGTPARVHVVLKGGGVSAGHEGEFTVDAVAENPWPRLATVSAHGRLLVAMDSPRTLRSAGIRADLSAKGDSFPDDFTLTTEVKVTRSPDEEDYAVALSRGSRQLASVVAHRPFSTGRVSGTWALDLRDSDWTPFFPERKSPSLAATGEGQFDADSDFARANVVGRLNATAGHLEVLAPSLDRLGGVAVAATFKGMRDHQVVRIDEVTATLTGDGSTVAVRSLQPFDFDASSGELKQANGQADWIEGTIQGLPLNWLSGLTDTFVFSASGATGAFVLRAADGGYALRTKTPLVATGVSVGRVGGSKPMQNFDLTLSLLAKFGSQGWQLELVPLAVSSAGRKLATVEGTMSRRAGDDQAIAIAGKWSADLAALLATKPAITGISVASAQSASGDFTASLGTVSQVIGKLAVIGCDPGHQFTADVRADIDSGGTVEFQAPLKLTIGPAVSEMLAEGTWSGDAAGDRISARLTGQKVTLDHLRRLAAPLAAATGLSAAVGLPLGRGELPRPAAAPDREPFWGQCVGTVTVAFDQVNDGEKIYTNVGGSLDLDHGSLRLERGRCGLPHQDLVRAEGLVSFDPAAPRPYGLKGTVEISDIDAGFFFGAPPSGQDPVMEGHFSLAGTVAGDGLNLTDLVGRAQEEFHLTSKNGIIRLLATQVTEAIPEETSSAVSDALGGVGSLMGKLLKVKGGIGSGEKKVSPATEAMLNFSSRIAEIGYEQLALTAIRESDCSVRLTEISLTSAEVRLTGSGRIAAGKDQSFRTQPLSLELKVGARGKIAELLPNSGLLSGQKDDLGYLMLIQPVHFGGSLEHIDGKEWHDLLVKAALRKPEEKGASGR